MEGRCIVLAKLPDPLFDQHNSNILLSPSLRHLVIWHQKKITVYNVSKQSDYEHKGSFVIWVKTNLNIDSALFSSDGKQLALLLNTQPKKIQLYRIAEKEVFLVNECIIEDKSHITRSREDVCESLHGGPDNEILVYLNSNQIVTYCLGSLSSYSFTSSEILQTYCASLPLDVISYHYDKQYFYCLCDTGFIYLYTLTNGNFAGVFEVYKTLPKDLRLIRLCVSSAANEVALVTSNNHVYILNISLAATAPLPSFQQQAPSSSASVSSFKTSTSKSSHYSRVESLRRESTIKKITSIANASSASTSWFSFLENLANRKVVVGTVEESKTFISIQDIPNKYAIQSLHFCQDSLGVWATHPENASDGFYRIYDKSNGQLESADILPPDTYVIQLDSHCVSLDLFLQASNLYLPLGVISRDTLIQKMIGGENEVQVDDMIGHTVLPLPLLQEGLNNLQIDLVRLALNLHTQGFKSKLSEGATAVGELVESTEQLFETIHNGIMKSNLQESWSHQVRRLALTHSNTLLSLLTTPAVQTDLQSKILDHVVLLRRGEMMPSVDLPVIPQWASWLNLPDEELILNSITSLNMVHCFLALHRGWTEEELQGERFFNTVQKVFVSLLQGKKFNQAIHLLTKVNLNPEKEIIGLFLKCKDPSLRDYLFENKARDLSDDLKAAWQFLTLLESILTAYSQKFPTFTRSPLNISDILSLSTKDRAQIVTDLYLSTGDPKLEGYLDKDACWTYLLSHNRTKTILAWITNGNSGLNNEWPLKVFSSWNIEQHLVDRVLSGDCTDLTKHVVCNKLASFGILTDTEKSNINKFLLRMAFAEAFPDLKLILDQETANVKHSQFQELLLSNAIQNNLIDLAVKLNTKDSHILWSPNWMKLIKLHKTAGVTWKQSDLTQAIEETTNYLASVESIAPISYLKQHPITAVVTDVLKDQNICQLHSHVSPLLAATAPLSAPSQEDITLYSVLAHTVPFHTDNIFRHQIGPKTNSNLPDFSNENLSLHHGMYNSLGFEDFLKQGRPGSAISTIFLKGKFPVRKKSAMACARGLAFCSIGDLATTSACIAFVELLGQDASQLRTQIAVARKVLSCIGEQNLHDNLLQFLEGKEGATEYLLKELETSMVNEWTSRDSSILDCLLVFHLAVRFCALHNLPAPRSLLQFGLERNNWLMFILPAQMFQYPLLRVQEITTSNVNCEISKHLYYALHGFTKAQKENECLKPFEPETNLIACLSHVGNNAKKLFSLSLRLNSSVLALLGASLHTMLPAEVGLSTWLLVSLCPEDAENCPSPPWTRDSVTQLLEEMVKKGYFYTIVQGFFIFQPVNPICALASFFIDSVVERKFKDSVLNLKLFIAAMYNLPNDAKQESTFLMSKDWITVTAVRMTCTALAHSFPSCYLKRCFLKTLCDAQFPGLIPDSKSLPLLLKLSECLAETPLQLDWERLCIHRDDAHLSELLCDLSKQHMFDVAFKFASIAGLPVDHVLVTQWSSLALSDENKGQDFWQRCNDSFAQANIDPKVAVSFFRSQARSSYDLQERYILLKFALNWLNKSLSNSQDITSLHFEMYMTCLEENFKIDVITEGCVLTPLHCLSDSLVIVPSQSAPPLSVSQCHRLDDIIHQLLITGDIQTAFLLQSLFHHTNQDCELLLACMRLAEGITSVSQLPTRIQEYLTADTLRRNKTTLTSPLTKRSSESSISHSDSQSILNTLYALQAHQTCPTPLFSNIISGFKISIAFNCDYKTVILDSDPLNRLLPKHSFDIATSLLNLACLTRFECTQYVCSQIVSVLSAEPVDDKYVLWGCDLESEFSSILDLSGSALLLGNSLLASDPPLSTSQLTSFKQAVELLILAHNCFTRICHMEGIESVLNLCRSLANRLLDCCQWPLMVRLLTGIGRYTEMNYVFQTLKANDQFEFLLGKGSDKLPQLMSATLEFVRHDKELFSLVAHHFSMYSELASLYEEEARSELGRLERTETGELLVTSHNQNCLRTAMSKYTDATEHYIQAKKMKCGVWNVQQAELVAVQMSLLTSAADSSVPCLTNLSNSEVHQLINTVLSCEQAHIVSRAYNISVDWGTALYYNCVLHGNTQYLSTWTKYHQLTKNIVQDVAHRFENERESNSTLEMNMKWFVSSVNLLDVKYRVASQLGFKDILQNLLNSPDMAYLKDTVWQRGFKNQIM